MANKSYFFIKGDFFKWHKDYVESKRFIGKYKYGYYDRKDCLIHDRYKESLVIVEEYKIFMCSLNDSDKEFLSESIKRGFFDYFELRNHSDILENWEKIVLDSHKHDLAEIDLKELGKRLKEIRIEKGFHRSDISRYLGIADRTLRSYEDGAREIGIKSLYKLIQLYGIGDVSDFLFELSK